MRQTWHFSAAFCLLSLLTNSACEIRIETGSNSWNGSSESNGSSFSWDIHGEKEWIQVRGNGPTKWVNGKLQSLADGSRLYLRRSTTDGVEHEIVLLRNAGQYSAAVRKNNQVSALNEQDREWLQRRVHVDLDILTSAEGLDEENTRAESIRNQLMTDGVIDFDALRASLSSLLFPNLLGTDFRALANRTDLQSETEMGLVRFLCAEIQILGPEERDAILGILAKRESLSSGAIRAIVDNCECPSYSMRTELALDLLTRENFGPDAGDQLLQRIRKVPYDGRSRVLSALYEQQKFSSAKNWMDAVLDEAPYSDRGKLLRQAIAKEGKSKDLVRSLWSQLGELPYSDRTSVFLESLKTNWAKTDAPLVTKIALSELPYQDRWTAVRALCKSEENGLDCIREALKHVEELPYQNRTHFLEMVTDRSDLTENDQDEIVRTIMKDAPHQQRGRLLVRLLQNPLSTEQTRDQIKALRKNLHRDQRELVEEFLIR